MDALCNACTKRPTCKSLCKAAEKYVSQDHVGQDSNTQLFSEMSQHRLSKYATSDIHGGASKTNTPRKTTKPSLDYYDGN